MVRLSNPLAFTPLPVIVWATATYIAIFAALLTVHLHVPNYPHKTPVGTNLTQAWADLQHITRQFHPYNSHANDEVRTYLLSRIRDIIASKNLSSDRVEIIDDNESNATFSSGQTSVYFEGTNVMVAIRGSYDKEPFYPSRYDSSSATRAAQNGGVLVNAHYDSVSTGYGATDDGMGVVSVLQLLSYFTEPENWPHRTIVLLLNNGEEDYLNGARAFMRHPISQLPRTFLNLEGAGAGGRATLFRSTDTEVTSFYKATRHPFGTVISGDGFKQGFIRSQTDYVIFNGQLGLRGLDIAFMEPRARYHTFEDSTRETSLKSLWHMLSASIATTSGLASDTSDRFSGSNDAIEDGKVNAGTGTDAVWFDLFGELFVLIRLHTLFALCVTLLVVAPVTLIGLTIALSKTDKLYPFARKSYVHSSDDDEPVHLNGWRGLFRFPFTFVVATAVVVALAYLLQRTNPYIVYSSPYAVWSMMLSTWISVAWFIMRGASAMRPSALQRYYALLWLFIGSFAFLVFATVLAHEYHVASGYSALFVFAAVYIAFLISYVELFFLPKKSAYAARFGESAGTYDDQGATSRPLSGATNGTRSDERPLDDDDVTETTSLLRNDRTSFRRNYGSRQQSVSDAAEPEEHHTPAVVGNPYEGEQEWSGKLPSWLWLVQFLLMAPTVLVLIGQVALLLTSAMYQTPADGNSTLSIYILLAALTAILAVPVAPFLHRFTYHVPMFLFCICVGTAVYNLVAFPFSREHKLKVYFLQQVDLDTGINTVSLTGVEGYVQDIIKEIPSAQGQSLNCTIPDVATRKELTKCSWVGLPARVAHNLSPYTNNTNPKSWLDYSLHKSKRANEATISVVGQNTRACRLLFDTPVDELSVDGAVSDPRFNATGQHGTRELRLWHRDWSQPWNVSVSWNHDVNSTFSGRVVCLWSDANADGIPAFDEVQHYLPVWSVATKISDGLVEGSKRFKL